MRSEFIANIVVYVIFAAILLFALKAEKADQNCADVAQTICGEGKGRAYYNSRPLPGDTKSVLLSKLVRTANYDAVSVHWRKAMIGAVISGFITSFVSSGKLPSGQSLAIHIIITFIIFYALELQFQHAVIEPATKQVSTIAALISAI